MTLEEDSSPNHAPSSPPSADLSRLRINRSSALPGPGIAGRRIGLGYGAGIGAALFLVGLFVGRLFFSNAESPKGQVQEDFPSTKVSSAPDNSSRALSEGPVPPRASGLAASGYVVAQRQAAVASQATGRLKELRVEEGDRVKAGDIIGVIENEGLQAAVRQEEASLRSAGARIASAQAGLAEISMQRGRIYDLFERKSVSQSEKDAVTASYERARAELAAAEADTELARARLDRAKVELGYSYIIAPFDGTVLTKNADEGEIVAPFGSSANARAAVVTIADMSSLEVEADVSESNLQRVVVGQDCSITLDSIPGKTYEGVVSNIVPTVDRAKATVLVKIKFKQLDERVIPEMSARVTLIDRK